MTRLIVAALLVVSLGRALVFAQTAPPLSQARPSAPLVFASAEDQHRAAVASRITLAVTFAADVVQAWQCEHRLRCFAVAGARTAATIGISETIKRVFPVARPCAPLDCHSDPPNADVPSEDTALATQAVGMFDQGGQCGPRRSSRRIAISTTTATGTAFLRRASWRHDLKGLLFGAGVGTGADYLSAFLLCR